MNFSSIKIEFILFVLILIGVAVFNKKTLWVALTGLLILLAYKFYNGIHFHIYDHFFGTVPLKEQLINKYLRQGEWSLLLNLFGLLLGFEILAKLFRESHIPDKLPKYLPEGWMGPFLLLLFIAVLSVFLDNIAAALIGGAIAAVVFNNKVHIGYLAAIVAASNAGGAGSVIGDTTTTMMWINGVSSFNVLHAFIASGITFLVFGLIASFQQNKYQKIYRLSTNNYQLNKIDTGKLFIVMIILIGAIIANILLDMPAIGVWLAIILGSTFRKIPWKEAKYAMQGTLFLLCLVSAASLISLDSLPSASWQSVFALGFVSAVFNNIPLTKLCLDQGHYDWGMLAYAIGFGGSILWFGSSAGVAITNEFPEARNTWKWLRNGWYIIIAYIVGFFALLYIMGWNPG